MKRKRKNRCKAKLRMWDDPILKQVCEPVPDDEDVSVVIRDMLYILSNSKTGVGLSAPQAGHAKRIIVISLNGFLQVMINPHVITCMDEMDTREEGCLSYPGRFKKVKRWTNIFVEYETEKRLSEKTRLINWSARIFQHELDHLDGICKVRGKLNDPNQTTNSA